MPKIGDGKSEKLNNALIDAEVRESENCELKLRESFAEKLEEARKRAEARASELDYAESFRIKLRREMSDAATLENEGRKSEEEKEASRQASERREALEFEISEIEERRLKNQALLLNIFAGSKLPAGDEINQNALGEEARGGVDSKTESTDAPKLEENEDKCGGVSQNEAESAPENEENSKQLFTKSARFKLENPYGIKIRIVPTPHHASFNHVLPEIKGESAALYEDSMGDVAEPNAKASQSSDTPEESFEKAPLSPAFVGGAFLGAALAPRVIRYPHFENGGLIDSLDYGEGLALPFEPQILTDADHAAHTYPDLSDADHAAHTYPDFTDADHVAHTYPDLSDADHAAHTYPDLSDADHAAHTYPDFTDADHAAHTYPDLSDADHAAHTYPDLSDADHAAHTYPDLSDADHAVHTYSDLSDADHAAHTYPDLSDADHAAHTYPDLSDADHAAHTYPDLSDADHAAHTYPDLSDADHAAHTYPDLSDADHAAHTYPDLSDADHAAHTYHDLSDVDHAVEEFDTYTDVDHAEADFGIFDDDFDELNPDVYDKLSVFPAAFTNYEDEKAVAAYEAMQIRKGKSEGRFYGYADNANEAGFLTHGDAFFDENATVEYDFSLYSRRELLSYLKGSDKRVRDYEKAISKTHKSMGKLGTEEKTRALIDTVNLNKHIVDHRAMALSAVVASGEKKEKRQRKRLLTDSINDYNAALLDYESRTGESLKRAPLSMVSDIASGKKYTPVPLISYPDEREFIAPDYEESFDFDAAPLLSRREKRREQLRFLKESEREEKRIAKLARKSAKDADRAEKLSAFREKIDRDVTLVKTRNEALLINAESELDYLENSFSASYKEKLLKRRELREKVKRLKKIKKKALKFERSDSERYYSQLLLTAEGLGVTKRRSVDKLDSLLMRLDTLLSERERINEQLIKLYSGDIRGNGGRKINLGVKKIKRRVAKKTARAFRSEMQVLDKRVPLDVKEKLAKSVNKIIDAEILIAVLKYKIRKTKPRGDVRRDMKIKIRENRASIKRYLADYRRFLKRAKQYAEDARGIKFQLAWILSVLAVLVLLTVLYLRFEAPVNAFMRKIFDFVKSCL